MSRVLNNKYNGDTLVEELVGVNREWESFISVVKMMKKKDNSNEKILVWYFKSNMEDLDKTFDYANSLIDRVKYSHDSFAYVNIYKIYDSIANFMESIIVSDKVVKRMDSVEYNSFMNILKRCEESMDRILSLPLVDKNVNRNRVMKSKKKSLSEMCFQYGKMNKARENRKDLLKKGLMAAAGFVSGAAMSCVPGVGYIRMGLATGKITTSAINRWIDRHPNGNVAKIFNKLGSKLNPKIPAFFGNVKDKLRGSYINVFLNGMAVGYIAGNIFELATGNTIIGAISEQFQDLTDAQVSIETSTADNSINIKVDDFDHSVTTTETVTPMVHDQASIAFDDVGIENPVPVSEMPIPVDNVEFLDNAVSDLETVPTIEFGQSIDVSGLEYGYGTSIDPLVGNEPVRLFNDLGHNVHIGNEKILNDGTKMWALFQEDGTGYAWFKADDVLDAVSNNGMKLVLK